MTSAWSFLEISRALKKAGRNDEALAWAQRGLTDILEQDTRLVEFLVDQLSERLETDQALSLAWNHFCLSPQLRTYKLLLYATRGGHAQQHWARHAKTFLLDVMYGQQTVSDNLRYFSVPNLLVEIAVYEGDAEFVLREIEVQECSHFHTRELTRLCEKSHPAQSAALYQSVIDEIVNRKNNKAYAEAATLLSKIKKLMHKSGMTESFKNWLSDVKQRHRQKVNFMKALDVSLSEKR